MSNEDSPLSAAPEAPTTPVVVWRGRRLVDAVEVARRLRVEGLQCAVSTHPEPWWVWQKWVLGMSRVLSAPEDAAQAREMLKVLSHLDDAMAFETPDHRLPNPWPRMWRWVAGLLLLAFLSAVAAWRVQW